MMKTRCSHAGGIVFRHGGTQPEYLLIRARDDPGNWVLPKGHIEEGENPRETATREVMEEAGVKARIVAPLGTLQLDDGCAEMFLMEHLGPGGGEPERACAWLELEAALRAVAFDESRDLLRSAHAIAGRRS